MFYKSSKKIKLNKIKLVFIILFLTTLMTLAYSYVNYKYDKVMNNYYYNFNNNYFDEASDIFSSNKLLFKLKSTALKNDLNIYLTSQVSKVCNDIKNGKILAPNAVEILQEINSYKLLGSSVDKLILSLDASYIPNNSGDNNSILNLAISQYSEKNYKEAINLLNNIPASDDTYYAKAKSYISKCKSSYKQNILNSADELTANKYYSKALDLLSSIDTAIVPTEDSDIQKKISSIQSAKDEYLSYGFLSDSEYTSTVIMDAITIDNINSLNIESRTNYFLYVNLEDQKTYIYEGSNTNWTLYKTFACSTGIEGEETPKGVYSISDRGEWFFADSYGQGGKYWVRFMGDYLFHSLPLDKTATEILDYTLGKPASHGCIRLNEEDAKWIYDNVNAETKVIIN